MSIERERTMWRHALERDHLPADTPHDQSVIDAEEKFNAAITRDTPVMGTWKQPYDELLDKLVSDRNNLARKMGVDKSRADSLQYQPRQTACPPAATPAPDPATSSQMNPSSDAQHQSQAAIKKSTTPTIILRQMPNINDFYPEESQRIGEQGVVVVSLKIDATGCPLSVAIGGSSGSDVLDAAALKSAELLSFYPATRDDAPVPATWSIAINFKPNGSQRTSSDAPSLK